MKEIIKYLEKNGFKIQQSTVPGVEFDLEGVTGTMHLSRGELVAFYNGYLYGRWDERTAEV